MLLLFHAGPVNISFADQNPRVDAILECFFPAQATGEALRHFLLNDVKGASPAGRLPYTWPMVASQVWRENGGWGEEGAELYLRKLQAFLFFFLLLPSLSLSLAASQCLSFRIASFS